MGTVAVLISRRLLRVLGAPAIALATMSFSVVAPALPSAWAQPTQATPGCPDVQVMFARGTGEPPGPGPTGQAFVDALRSRVVPQSYDVYSVNYPASDQWDTGLDGIRDADAHLVSMVHDCPATKMVLGGYSQGAAVMGFITSSAVPDGIDPIAVPKPLDPDVASHVSSVVLFGTPNDRAMSFLGEPPLTIGPLYQAKTLAVCVPEDPVCSDGLDFAAHNTYADNSSMINTGVDFAVNRINTGPLPGPPAVKTSPGFGS